MTHDVIASTQIKIRNEKKKFLICMKILRTFLFSQSFTKCNMMCDIFLYPIEINVSLLVTEIARICTTKWRKLSLLDIKRCDSVTPENVGLHTEP